MVLYEDVITVLRYNVPFFSRTYVKVLVSSVGSSAGRGGRRRGGHGWSLTFFSNDLLFFSLLRTSTLDEYPTRVLY